MQTELDMGSIEFSVILILLGITGLVYWWMYMR
jgi:hypothetical protein